MLKFLQFTFNGVPGEVSNQSKIAMKKVNLYDDGLFPPAKLQIFLDYSQE